MHQVDTPHGPAQVEFDQPAGPPRGVLALGHGAGGGVTAPDILAARDAAVAAGLTVARITQPYRVAGRRAPAPAHQLDTAWAAVLATLPAGPLVVGGRSSGARVACRTAVAVGALAVLTLAFPVHLPGRPEKSRLPELDTGLPTLCIAGGRDPFGVPPEAAGRAVLVIPDAVHDLRKDLRTVRAAVQEWLAEFGP